ncbi:hypothetical protein D3872_18450 [Massilia cavernae]|uniref:Copper amine oxidase catalytic domain-containing protein n=1 Tax=Massilia cavernae TaxID=2320864 RepID=A0A418XGT4_9BURK|nr:hypothetical protein D3872_18450 [Massilia cavernae]
MRQAQGPTLEEQDAFIAVLLAQPSVANLLANTRYRVLAIELLENDEKTGSDLPAIPLRYGVQVYDYTNSRNLELSAIYPDASRLEILSSARQPLPSAEEWEEAAEIVAREEIFARHLLCGLLTVYRPMPPFLERADPTGAVARTLTVGLLSAPDSNLRHQIVAVNMVTQRVEHFDTGAPPGAHADPTTCGIPPFYCPAPRRGTPGQLWISWPTVNPVWELLAIRPAASSGREGSGLEIRFANYRGKRVLYRGHVPVLNVKYAGDECGPYRDWQYEEHCFQVDGTDVAPGFRWTNRTPVTSCSGSDAGNFTGVAVQTTECELIVTTEMAAGWYRYIQEWRFHRDGTIRPRFRFAAARNSCVCKTHVHHVYWRLDLDLRTAGNNRVEEFNDPPIIGGTNWHRKLHEIKRLRDTGRRRKWRVTNTVSGERYEIIPGPTDGVVDAYGRGDLWFLRYRGAEIDDGGPSGGTEVQVDRYVNGEAIDDTDVVVWYGAHFRHDPSEQGPAECHAVGPTLRPIQW